MVTAVASRLDLLADTGKIKDIYPNHFGLISTYQPVSLQVAYYLLS